MHGVHCSIRVQFTLIELRGIQSTRHEKANRALSSVNFEIQVLYSHIKPTTLTAVRGVHHLGPCSVFAASFPHHSSTRV